MGAEVKDSISTKDLLKIGVVSSKAVMGGSGLGEEETHRISLITKSGLDTDEDVAVTLAVDQHVLAVSVELAVRRRGEKRERGKKTSVR